MQSCSNTFCFLVVSSLLILLGTTPVHPCVHHDCSNDVDQPGSQDDSSVVHGDERLVWSAFLPWADRSCRDHWRAPCTTDANERCWEIASYPDFTTIKRLCETTRWSASARRWSYYPPPRSFLPYALGPEHFPRIGVSHRYVIRACAGATCSDWGPKTIDGEQDYVEFVGVDYACFGSENGERCEKVCYSGAPKMFREIPDCSDPY